MTDCPHTHPLQPWVPDDPVALITFVDDATSGRLLLADDQWSDLVRQLRTRLDRVTDPDLLEQVLNRLDRIRQKP